MFNEWKMLSIDTEFLDDSQLVPQDIESLEELKSLLKEQEKDVISVRLLPNFGTDYDMSIKMGRKILKGVQVQLRETYTISHKDALWFHPSICHVRSSFEIALDKKVPCVNELQGLYNRIGTYETTSVDEFGMSSSSFHAVLDTSTKSDMWNDIMKAETSLQSVYERIKDANLIEDVKAEQEQWIMTHVGESHKGSSIVYNVFCSNGDTIAFYNDCTATKEDQLYLIDKGPVHGYLSVRSKQVNENVFKNTIPLSMGTTNGFYKWKDLSEKHREKFMKVDWGDEQCSTQLMRMPLRLSIFETEKWALNMKVCVDGNFSMTSLIMAPHHVSSLLPVQTMLEITPTSQEVEVEDYGKGKSFTDMYRNGNICVPFTIESELVCNVLRDRLQIEKEYNFSILNPVICKNNLVFLPREVVRRYASNGKIE